MTNRLTRKEAVYYQSTLTENMERYKQSTHTIKQLIVPCSSVMSECLE